MAITSRPLAALALCLAAVASPLPAFAQEPSPSITTSALATVQDIDTVSVSPDGRWVAFVVRKGDPATNRYVQDWMLLSLETGESRRIAEAGEPILAKHFGLINGSITPIRAAWSPDSDAIIYRRLHQGRVELWRTSLADGLTRRITELAGNVEDDLRPDPGGRTARFRVGPDPDAQAAALKRESLGGFLLDTRFLPSFSREPIMPGDRQRDTATGVTTAESFDAQRRNLGIDLLTSVVSTVEPAENEARRPETERAPFVDGPGGRRAWFEARDPQRQGGLPPITLMARRAEGSTAIACEHSQCTGIRVPAAFWHGDEVLFVRREGITYTSNVLYAWNTWDGSLRRVFDAGEAFSDWMCGQTQRELICRYEEALRPARLVAIDVDTGSLRTLYDANPDFQDLESSFHVERIDAVTDEGVPTFGYVVKRADLADAALPLVVVTYRCSGFLRGGTGDEYPILPLASEGFAALCFGVPDLDYERLAILGYGDYAREQRENHQEKLRVHAGLEAIVQETVRRGHADPRRVAVTGLSFGAETTGYAMFNMSNLTAAVASSAAMAPSNVFLSGAGWRAWEAWGLADPNGQAWRDLSVVHNTSRIRAPLLLNLSDYEMIGAMEVYGALDRAGRAVEAFIYPGDYHIKWQPAHRLAVYNRNIDWLSFWLRGGEEGRTGALDQYARWRTMRSDQCRLFGPDGSERHARPRGHEAMSDEALIPWYCLI